MSRIQVPALCVAFALLASAAQAQTTWYVDAAAVPPGDGSAASPYASIQHAHDQASTQSGDTLALAAGVYSEHLVFDQGKALALVGAGTAATRLTGGLEVHGVPGTTRVQLLAFEQGPVNFLQSDVELERVLVKGVGTSGSLASIQVSGADSVWRSVVVSGNPGGGAGIFGGTAVMDGCRFLQQTQFSGGVFASNARLTFRECFFGWNQIVGGHGGGLRVDHCETVLVDCDFTGNSVSDNGRLGGAIYQGGGGALTIDGGRFSANIADRGGALALLGPATIRNVEFQANLAQRDANDPVLSGQGGAIYVSFAGTLDAEDCEFRNNTAPAGLPLLADDQLGGAIYAVNPGSRVARSLFRGNRSGQGGSAVHGPLRLERCVVREGVDTDAGGAVHGAELERCTVAGNAGHAAVVDTLVTNSILWANSGAALGGSASATWSCVEGGAAGLGNVADDPLFADLAQGDVALLAGSPCIDAGDPAAPADPDLTPADMGAEPFTWMPVGASYCSANPNSSGASAVMALLGSAQVADDFLRAQATHTATHQLGLFLMSREQGFVPFFGGSQGNLCLAGTIHRVVGLPDSVGPSGPLGVLNARLSLLDPPYGPPVLPGETWNVQAWFRDVVDGALTSNTSDAVTITLR